MKVAVIGAEGFIGKRLCHFLERTEEVSSVLSLAKHDFDLTKPDTWKSLDNTVDCVVHAAVMSEGGKYEIYNVNCLNIGSFSKYCNSLTIKKIIYLSTGSTNNLDDLQNDYILSKYLAEIKIAKEYSSHLNILKLYYPYGEGQSDKRLIPKLINRVKNDETVICNADGGPRLPIGHVDDLAKIIVDYFIAQDNPQRVTNIASDQIMSVAEIIETISSLLDKKVKLSLTGNQPEHKIESYVPGHWRPIDLTGMLADTLNTEK